MNGQAGQNGGGSANSNIAEVPESAQASAERIHGVRHWYLLVPEAD